jgi:tRNA (cmo5U34)-methyltransferase
VVVSAFAIHHLDHSRKRALSAEVFDPLAPSGIFANLGYVSSPTERLHEEFLAVIGYSSGEEDASNRCAAAGDHLAWLAAAGFTDVDYAWKWRELALLVARRPPGSA